MVVGFAPRDHEQPRDGTRTTAEESMHIHAGTSVAAKEGLRGCQGAHTTIGARSLGEGVHSGWEFGKKR